MRSGRHVPVCGAPVSGIFAVALAPIAVVLLAHAAARSAAALAGGSHHKG